MKLLDGAELADYIKERQAKQVRALRQSWRVIPRLAIVRMGEDAVTDRYLRLKQQYGEDILVETDVHMTTEADILEVIDRLNKNESVHGIIIQLPLSNSSQTETAVNAVAPEKDVDGLGRQADFTPATALAIDWLLAGYGVELTGKNIAIVGNGRLVGAPLTKIWQAAGLNVSTYDDQTTDLTAHVLEADIIITATGVPGLITPDMIKPSAVIVDAGAASENGKIVGDISPAMRDRQDLTLTPDKGGVGPLTIATLFDNVILAARRVADKKGQQDI